MREDIERKSMACSAPDVTQSMLDVSQNSDKFVLAENNIGRLFKSKNLNVESDY